jgi:hypothetical protein
MDFSNIKDPLVRDYLTQKYGTNKVQEAQTQADNTELLSAGVGAADKIANAFGNQPVIMQNRMQDLGRTPDMIAQPQQKTDVSGLQKQAQMKLQQAQSDEDNAVKMAFEQRKAELAQEAAAKKMEADEAYRAKDLQLRERGIDAQARSRNAYADMQNWLAQQKLDLERKKFDAEQAKPKPLTPAEQKKAATNQEVDYRVNSINSALDRLEKNVKDNGTFEVFGNASTDMDKDLYNVALDYAKLVDPESVAREGEVAAAQKYMLPIKGLTVKNSTALDAIKSMKDTVKQRASDMRGQTTAPAKVKVSNGKEILEIDPSDLADAEKDGYKRLP